MLLPLSVIWLNRDAAWALDMPGGAALTHCDSLIVLLPLLMWLKRLLAKLDVDELDVPFVASADVDEVEELRSLVNCCRSCSICCSNELIEVLLSLLVDDVLLLEEASELLSCCGGGGGGGAAFCNACVN